MLSAIKSSNEGSREGKLTKDILFKMRNECWDEQVTREVRGNNAHGTETVNFI